ncbi:adenosine kinase [Lobosporangium transversale]|uniref:Adenosine kinase n=1 Tax=Lobosporangium transversale TaxID=64571 RepID=A0A1Y2GSB1_9FUNG|nr:adenosine kinase [Lobosporangium transversale]ORZ21037.1 adenosine kinase [Lobosporangium transversale]|eukprot:XP_021882946.1 adenosine kinase [Lobosporangium transversale]
MASYSLFCMGNPLLDIQVKADEDLLARYHLKSNDAILADESHQSLYEEIILYKDVVYVAGGASQNTARGAQRLLPPKSVVYVGATAQDKFRDQLVAAATVDGLTTEYVTIPGDLPTGTCAALISGHDRSLVTKLSAAEKFTVDHIRSERIWRLVENARVYYVEGYFLTVTPEGILEVAKHASKENKIFTMNLSAPFIPQFFTKVLDEVLPYMDIVFGNEGEAEAYATAHNLPNPKDVKATATYISQLPKENDSRKRIVVFTQGINNTIVVDSEGNIQEYPIIAISESDIVDCNGAGDAFCGGFLAKIVEGASIADAVAKGHYLAHQVIQQVGPTYPRNINKD